jgi:hypothetical protein
VCTGQGPQLAHMTIVCMNSRYTKQMTQAAAGLTLALFGYDLSAINQVASPSHLLARASFAVIEGQGSITLGNVYTATGDEVTLRDTASKCNMTTTGERCLSIHNYLFQLIGQSTN